MKQLQEHVQRLERLAEGLAQRPRIAVILHPAEEGGFWAEVPALPGCASEGETVEETLANIREAITGVLDIGVKHLHLAAGDQVHEVEL
jgi:predicted RNase H-like HicB family nuclease